MLNCVHSVISPCQLFPQNVRVWMSRVKIPAFKPAMMTVILHDFGRIGPPESMTISFYIFPI